MEVSIMRMMEWMRKGLALFGALVLLLTATIAFAASYPFNGVVTSDTNMRSTANSYAICDIGTSYDADIRDIEKVILPALPEIYERNKDVFISEPTYSGVQQLADSAVVVRVMALTSEENYFIATRRLNREMKILFDENGIEIPFNQMVIHNA